MSRKAPLLEHAREYLRKETAAAAAAGLKSIPGVRVLAQKAGVSIGTMNKAVREMKASGELLCTPGAGIYLVRMVNSSGIPLPARSSNRPPKGFSNVWQEIYIRLVHRLRQGYYPPGTVFPSFKNLSEELGVSYSTLRKACEQLCLKKIIEPYRRTYRVIAPLMRNFRNSLMLITGGVFPDSIAFFDFSRMRQDLAAIERECNRRGVNLIIVIQNMTDRDYGYYRQGNRIQLDRDFIDRNGILGFIICNYNLDENASVITYQQVRHFPVPAVLYDVTGADKEHVPHSRSFPLIRTAALSETCGRAVARYLLGLGHRACAYIAPQERLWSEIRLAGFTNAVRDSAFDCAVHECTGSEDVHSIDSSEKFFNRIVPPLEKILVDMNDPFSLLFAKILYSKNLEIRTMVIRENEYLRDCRIFSNALALEDVTAWVCHNDRTALNALKFLRERSIAVPQVLSVVGFDDAIESCVQQITSYNFNSDAVARALVSTVLKGPRYLMVSRDKKQMEIEGFVVERSTTAPPR